MNILERATNILVKPKEEWRIVAAENDENIKSATVYLLILALIPAVASFISWGLIGGKVLFIRYANPGLGLRLAVTQYLSIIAGAYLTALVFYFLAPNFGARKRFDKSFQLVAYCYTAVCAGGIFYIYWGISFLAAIASLYSLYLLYLGLEPLMQVPKEKLTGYFVVGLIVMIVVSVVVNVILGSVFDVRALTY